MKVRVGICFVVLADLFGAMLGKMEDVIIPVDEEKIFIAEYDVVVRRIEPESQLTSIWAGVILNDRFVLSVDPYPGKKKISYKELSIIVGYNHIGALIESPRSYFLQHRGIYNAQKIWLFKSILLIMTEKRIIFRSPVRGIKLPVGDDLRSWKNTFLIPNKGVFTTSYWCRQDELRDYYFRVISEKRNCSMDICIRNNGLVPSCLPIEIFKDVCILSPGAPLVYNNILVGVRREKQFLETPGKYLHDYFVNLAPYKTTIDKFMQSATQGILQPAPIE